MNKKQGKGITQRNIDMLTNDTVEKMRSQHGIIFAPGLTYNETIKIERIYNIHFPKSFRDFLTQALPVSNGFYNWRDTSEENVNYIKSVMAKPKENLYELAEEADWCETRGEKPPVLSIHGTDVIYYGETLLDYFNIELGEKKQADIAFERIVPVPFWSEIM